MSEPLRILNVNCRSVVNKATELETLLLTHYPDLVTLTETWLNSTVFDSEIIPPGYNLFRKDRGSKGGGVAVVFKSCLTVIRMPDIPQVEGLFCKIYHNNIQYVVASIYRPPNSSIEVITELKKYLCTHAKPGARIILSGDFNLPDIDWASFSTTKHNDILGEAMLDVAFTFDLLQVVKDFTRVQGSSKSVLDLVFVSGCINASLSCEVVPGISDHSAVLLTLANGSRTKKRKMSCFRNFSRADDTSITDHLSFNFDLFSNNSSDVQNLWDSFKHLVNECIDRFVPCVIKKKERKKPLDFSGHVTP